MDDPNGGKIRSFWDDFTLLTTPADVPFASFSGIHAEIRPPRRKLLLPYLCPWPILCRFDGVLPSKLTSRTLLILPPFWAGPSLEARIFAPHPENARAWLQNPALSLCARGNTRFQPQTPGQRSRGPKAISYHDVFLLT